MNEQEKTAQQRKRNKKTVLTILIVCAVILVLSALTATLDPDELVAKLFEKDEPQDTEEKEISFYEADWEANILEDEEYLDLDRNVYFNRTSTGETISLDEENLSTFEEGVQFFYGFFDSIIRGTAATYTDYFTDAYLQSHEMPEKFTMQMLYDMEISEYQGGDSASGDESCYLISYKIHKNNGTFRQDLESDACRAQIICLTREGDRLKIKSVVNYTHY